MTQGVTGMMVNSLEMIIKFSNEIVKVHGMEIPPRKTWMDGLEKGDPCNSSHVMHYGLKILFVLMCSPHATDKKLKSLDCFLNSSNFSLDIVSSMSATDIACKIQQMGMQNKNAIYIQQAFQKIKHVYAGNIPNDATVLNDNFDGIGMKIALLVVQYIHGLIQVSDFSINVLAI